MLFRTVVEVAKQPIVLAGVWSPIPDYAGVFLNGQQVAARAGEGEEGPQQLAVEFTARLRPGRSVLIVSAVAAGLALQGTVLCRTGATQSFGSGSAQQVGQ